MAKRYRFAVVQQSKQLGRVVDTICAVGGIVLDGETRERLLEASRLATLGRLLPSVVHQLSTPIAAIALRVEGLERTVASPETPASREKAQRYLLAMGEETQRCRDLLSALRDFSRGGGGSSRPSTSRPCVVARRHSSGTRP